MSTLDETWDSLDDGQIEDWIAALQDLGRHQAYICLMDVLYQEYLALSERLIYSPDKTDMLRTQGAIRTLNNFRERTLDQPSLRLRMITDLQERLESRKEERLASQ